MEDEVANNQISATPFRDGIPFFVFNLMGLREQSYGGIKITQPIPN